MDRKETKEKWMDDSTDFLKNIFQEIEKICNDLNLNNYEDDIAARSTVEFLAEWLRFLDGIMLLFIQGRVDIAQVLTRSLYEITLQLLYLIKDKETMNKKAICYVAFSELKKYSTNNNMIKNKNKIGVDTSKGEIENKKILESLGSSKNEELRFLYKYFLDKGFNRIHCYRFKQLIRNGCIIFHARMHLDILYGFINLHLPVADSTHQAVKIITNGY